MNLHFIALIVIELLPDGRLEESTLAVKYKLQRTDSKHKTHCKNLLQGLLGALKNKKQQKQKNLAYTVCLQYLYYFN